MPFATDFDVDLDISDTVGTSSASGAGQVTVSSTGSPSEIAPDYGVNVTIVLTS